MPKNLVNYNSNSFIFKINKLSQLYKFNSRDYNCEDVFNKVDEKTGISLYTRVVIDLKEKLQKCFDFVAEKQQNCLIFKQFILRIQHCLSHAQTLLHYVDAHLHPRGILR